MQSAGSIIDLPLTEDTSISLVWCPPSKFTMGSPEYKHNSAVSNEIPHQVVLTHGFWIAQTPITQNIWEIVMGRKFRSTGQVDDAQLPVEGVSWNTAIIFCEKLSQLLRNNQILSSSAKISLPTEAQWEYACRSGTQTPWYFGTEKIKLDEYAWYQTNSEDRVHPVGLKKPNSWGIYDLYGNVAEWCLDDIHMYDAVEVVDPCYVTTGDSQLKIVRGGSYSDQADICRSASRKSVLIDNAFVEETGVRIVCVYVDTHTH
ncbi:MAG: formylglycine-generating enzyme family protein [Goleter apudmare HA4340-LM2]|jgi:formylglycine-generating enzyme required for sulfatase activity|nr:formylglycine-generating enzyme family protein [Goleter apudmare HA4340-LM2]